MSSCIFCRIVAREIPAEIVHESDQVLAFRDLRPVAPTHVLVITKRHIDAIREADDTDAELLGHVMIGARDGDARTAAPCFGVRVSCRSRFAALGGSAGLVCFWVVLFDVSGR